MAKKQSGKGKRRVPKTVLRLPDLGSGEVGGSEQSQFDRCSTRYRHAIKEFIEWYCSEPRLSFSKAVVLRYRIHLESRHLAPGTINLRLGAVRRLAYEASDCGLLSPDLGRWHTTRQGSQEDRRPTWELADAGTVAAALERT